MRQKLAVDEESAKLGIVPYGCVCHGFNNFGKDVCKRLGLLPKVMNQNKVVATVFRNVKFAKLHLNKEQKAKYGNTLQLRMPVDTRWNSNTHMLTSVMRSKDALLTVVIKSKHEDLTPAIDLTKEFSGKNTAGLYDEQVCVAELIEEPGFWKRQEQALMLLRPISSAVTYLENDLAPLSSLSAMFVKLLRTYAKVAILPDDVNFPFRALQLTPNDFKDTKDHSTKTLPDLLRRRWGELTAHTVNPSEPSECSGLLQLALYLDLGTRGLVYLAIQEGIMLDKEREMGDAVLAGAKYLCNMIKKDSRFANLAESVDGIEDTLFNELSAGIQRSTADLEQSFRVTGGLLHPLKYYGLRHQAEAVMAKALFPLMTSAAGGERSFNVYGSTHSKKGNRMGNAKLDAVVRVRMNTQQLIRKSDATSAAGSRTIETLGYLYSAEIGGSVPAPLQVVGNDDDSEDDDVSESDVPDLVLVSQGTRDSDDNET